MKATRRLYSPTAIRNRLLRLMEEVERLENEEQDPLILAETLPEIINKAGQQLLRGGFGDLYEKSLRLVTRINAADGVDYLPIANPVKTKSFLSQCLAAVEHRFGIGPINLGRATADCVPQDLGFAPTTHKGERRSTASTYAPPAYKEAYRQYKEAEAAHGGMVSDFDAYKWLMGKYHDMPKYMNWERYARGGRRFFNDNKNQPRAGRNLGKTIVRADEI